jgi:hypothetical protein
MRRVDTLRIGKRLNVRINRFVTRAITPVVLVAGLLLLMVLHFQGVLETTTAQDNLFHGQRSYSAGDLAFTFQEQAGTDRPGVHFDGAPVLSWVEWNSSISVDGSVANLWDSYHGYSYDDTKRQVFATMSGTGWQVIEVVTLVNAHTVRVDYQFVAGHDGNKSPGHVELRISHAHNTLYQPRVSGDRLTASVLPNDIKGVPTPGTTTVLHPFGDIGLTVSGPQVAADPISIDDLRGITAPDGTQQALASSFTTTYVVDNPQVNRMIQLGSETLTFTSTQPAGVPIPANGPTPVP